ncbi:hypothetical protein UCYN_09090 [Candidatus Atelocyanobacterium thalassa isolate ALOHA]|uniref:Uncharacterized protein n=1 Tax=Atelocyanobacterium thalassa (isolate ALOHA) TaxID=1453429 RepID=D3EQ43_ATETH|nr:hypothetical protein UCYN_09090 [Candidatus Atelocyanobacterium thalassa isolate ALOHA]|tara:strand:+ start:46102 stop:46212 length:111 start_codon:yes stop_codon:yes gene_type:complete
MYYKLDFKKVEYMEITGLKKDIELLDTRLGKTQEYL